MEINKQINMNATIQFTTAYGKYVVMSRNFNNQLHLDNFISYVSKKYSYTLDEVWY
jgi:hypothetical protein